MKVCGILLFLVVTTRIKAEKRRHTIYWDSFMTPNLSSRTNYVKHVKIGDFMDVICPQTDLMTITNGPRNLDTFNIFNVTEGDFKQCRRKEKSNFIFSCDRPEQENKLTIKFQVISPSPLGFRFRYCQDYYFLAVPNVKTSTRQGCHDNSSTRLHIKVACKDPPLTTPTTTAATTTTTTTRSTTTTTKSTTTLPPVDIEPDLEEEIVNPPVVRPRPPGKNRTLEGEQDTRSEFQTGNQPPGGGNSCAQLSLSNPLFILTSLFAFFVFSLMTSPFT